MNKKLIALALAGAFAAPLAAQAQSTSGNVTIYGFLRIAAEGATLSGSTAALPATQSSGTRMRVVDNSSALGFRGEEDLGGGLKAIFQLESAVLPDGSNGGGVTNFPLAANAGWMTRNTHVGLKGNWGEFSMGRWDVYYHDQVFADINILKSSLAASTLAIIGSYNGAYLGGTRLPNVLNYTTPTMNGFSAKIQYHTGVNEIKTAAADERAWALRLWYLSGPAHAGFSYIRRTDMGNVAGSDLKGSKLYGRYTFNDATTVGLIWEKLDVRASSAASFASRNAAALTLNHQMGMNHLHFNYGSAGNVAGLSNTGAKYWTVGYGYDFSKRTTGHITYAKIKNQSAGNYDFFSNGGVCGGNLTACTATGADPAVFQVGVTHNF